MKEKETDPIKEEPFKKNGSIKDLPYSLRKKIYDEIMKIDFEKHNSYIKKLQDEGKDGWAARYETDIPGLIFVIGPDSEEILVLINMLIQETGEKMVMAARFSRGEENKLSEE